MIGNLLRHLFHLVVYILIFFGLVWLLLDISPRETYRRSKINLSNLSARFGSFSSRTISGMKESAQTQAQHASDRFHGKDPYERLAERMDATVGRGGALETKEITQESN